MGLLNIQPIHKLIYLREKPIYACNPAHTINIFKTDEYTKKKISCKNCLKVLEK